MDSIATLLRLDAAVAPDVSIAFARAMLAPAPHRHALAVADQGRPLGLVPREACLTALDSGVSLGTLMDTAPLLIDAAADVLEACRLVAQHQLKAGHDGFLVVENGLCLGAGSLRALLEGLIEARFDAPGPQAGPTDDGHAGIPFKRQFLDMIGHELRGPLEAVMAMTECLERQPLASDAQSHVRAIRESGEALQRIVAAAVDLTQAENGLMAMTCSPVLLRGLVDDIQAEWASRAARDGVTLLTSFDGDTELTAMTDPARLRQLFDCLIGSALRQTRSGSIEVGLKASVEHDGMHIQGRVRDTGPGLSADKLARVFDPRSDPAGRSLGVALAGQIVAGLNGFIRAESNIGTGVSMIFDFICDQAAKPAQETPHASAGGFGAAHILVVDDNATNRMVAEALCEMFDCTSECACDGVEAVEIARSGRFDVILMDIKMPRMDGIAATRAIRALSGRAGVVPIIALTANADPEDARAYLASGMCSVVEKPIKPERLLQAINDALAGASDDKSAAA